MSSIGSSAAAREEVAQESAIAEIVLGANPGAVLVLAGVNASLLHRLIDEVVPRANTPRALFLRIARAQTTEAVVHQLTDHLASTAQRLWPIWYTGTSFAECGQDMLGRLAAHAIVRRAAAQIPDLQTAWADMAVELALDRRLPRVRKVSPEVEVGQLALAISREGLVLVVDAERACTESNPAAIVHALEWIAQLTRCAVVALFRALPPHEPPFDRILYGAHVLVLPEDQQPARVAVPIDEPWLAPWLGSPHPLSETEQRLERALRTDKELSSLFDCNQFIETVRGSRPKVDFVWGQGRLVVELDGYGSHGNRAAFMYDRHRDYELMLSGYTVLRISNDEIAQDIGKAVEKIRDIVQLCRSRIN
jgi:very-short-patch-repair endonuclease